MDADATLTIQQNALLEAYEEAAGHLEACAGEERESLGDNEQAEANDRVAKELRVKIARLIKNWARQKVTNGR